jgi:hypothetical protein
MTLWPPQEQANDEMWGEYLRKTARPGLLEEMEAAAQAGQQPPAPEGPTETPQRRGRVSENPQPEKDA